MDSVLNLCRIGATPAHLGPEFIERAVCPDRLHSEFPKQVGMILPTRDSETPGRTFIQELVFVERTPQAGVHRKSPQLVDRVRIAGIEICQDDRPEWGQNPVAFAQDSLMFLHERERALQDYSIKRSIRKRQRFRVTYGQRKSRNPRPALRHQHRG